MSGLIPRTVLTFQHNAKLYTLPTSVLAVTPFPSLAEADRQLFKSGTADDDSFAVVTRETIFHPQGGGQPSDTGSMSSSKGDIFSVHAVRMSATNEGQVLHLGRFHSSDLDSTDSTNSTTKPPPPSFTPNEPVTQNLDVDKRLLYSRLHTAGHVLGAAVRHLLESQVPNFDELKASHFPDSAACEFAGLIEGKWKNDIQANVDEYVAAAMPVEVDFWTDEDFRANGLERLIPNNGGEGGGVKLAPGEKYRVVKIVGAEVYPCGGTHVDTTEQCGKVGVRKISRSKGTSRVSYNVS
ncbi:hypothetical protein LTR46_006602 [Exophiala xenobiotica]|nr:hypothetical protein LTR46_006602 [Exophiala xenobiotica]